MLNIKALLLMVQMLWQMLKFSDMSVKGHGEVLKETSTKMYTPF